MATTVRRTSCNLCEAICGVLVTGEDARVTDIRGDESDPLSRGHICPKAVALRDLQDDPDRLTTPVRRTPDGWQEIGWDAAYELVIDKLTDIQRQHGRNSVGVYLGNPNVHSLGALTHMPTMMKLLRTRNRFSATSIDQLPHMLASYLLYGHQLMVAVPDIDRTSYLLMLGANPLASNGSMMTAPGFGRPGTDAAFLLALIHQVIEDGHARPAAYVDGFAAVEAAVEPWTAERAAGITGIDADVIRGIAGEFAGADRAACYGR